MTSLVVRIVPQEMLVAAIVLIVVLVLGGFGFLLWMGGSEWYLRYLKRRQDLQHEDETYHWADKHPPRF